MKNILLTLLVTGLTIPQLNPSIINNASQTSTLQESITVNQEHTFVSIDPTASISSLNKTPFNQIANTNYEASIVGRYESGKEEGYSTVLIKDLTTNSYKEFKFQEINSNNQLTALKVPCGTGDTVFIIVGSAFGRLSYGGSLYSLNVQTGESKLVESTFNSLEQIVNAQIDGSQINLTCYLFDDNYNNYVTYNRAINY